MCQPRRKLQIAAIHEIRKINKKNRLIKLNELIFHQNQSFSACISKRFNVKIQRGMLTTKYIHALKTCDFYMTYVTNTDICG